MNKNKKSPLPSGFYDRFGKQAYYEHSVNNQIVEILDKYSYELVLPCFMEFEDSLDRNFSSEFFKVTDPASNKMMVLRNDITPQIARIVSKNIKNRELRRISYTGSVIKKKGDGKFLEREIKQTGFELIGERNVTSEAEIILILSDILNSIKCSEYSINFCYPYLLEILGRDLNLEVDRIFHLQNLLEDKDLDAEQNVEEVSILKKLISLFDKCHDLETAIEIFEQILADKKLSTLENMTVAIEYIHGLMILLKRNDFNKNIKMSFDLFERNSFDYHTGLCFSVISRENLEELGRGGRYKIYSNKERIDAVGFTFKMDSIIRNIKDKEIGESVNIEDLSLENGDFKKIKDKQEENIENIKFNIIHNK
jgi:ATP phosphoribosyltransferase regulatory subunit